MGTWGTAISSNDTFYDIYNDFIENFNESENVKVASEFIINKTEFN